MNVVLRHDIPTDNVVVDLPVSGIVIAAGEWKGRPAIWEFHFDGRQPATRKFIAMTTGTALPDGIVETDFIGTVRSAGNTWHVFNAEKAIIPLPTPSTSSYHGDDLSGFGDDDGDDDEKW